LQFFDIDGSGELDKEEFSMAMERFGMTLSKKEIDGFFRRSFSCSLPVRGMNSNTFVLQV